MHYTFILNPAAQNRRAGRRRPALEAALRAEGVDFSVLETEAPGHASRLARTAARTSEVVVAVGGDGTNQEVARGVYGTNAMMGVLPLGTGNDFAHAVGMPDDLGTAVRALLGATPQPVDLGRIRWQERADGGALKTHDALFSNCVGAGFDALTAAYARRYKRLGGRTAYVAGVLRSLWQWRQPSAHVEILLSMHGADEAERARSVPVAEPVGAAGQSVLEAPQPAPVVQAEPAPLGLGMTDGLLVHEGGLFLIEVCNGFSVGGGFLLTPDAQVDDTLLDICFVDYLPTRRVLQIMPKTFSGAHIGEPEVQMHQARRITVRSSEPLPVQADGEILSSGARTLDIEVLPAALSFLAPQIRRTAA